MNRREFLEKNFAANSNKLEESYNLNNDINQIPSDRSNMIASLDTETKVLDKISATHLLRRIGFGPKVEEINAFIGKTPQQAVAMLLGDGKDYLAENKDRLRNADSIGWLNSIIEDPKRVALEIRFSLESTHQNRYNSFLNWWTSGMVKQNYASENVVEKFAFFWHTHWCVEFKYDTEDYIPPPLLFRNYDKLRKYRLGNFRDMVKEMTLDGAYLLYQGLNSSNRLSPNENFMRELMELFTMGIGNYTEGDIREGSRVLTGWRVTAHIGDRKPYGNFDTYFDRDAHDIGAKTIMGETIKARDSADNSIDKVKKEEMERLVDILFERRPQAIAEFICEKMYKFYVYSNPSAVDRAFIGELSKVFINSNFELLPVFTALFTSKHFYQAANYGIQIKTPIELLMGLIKTSYMKEPTGLGTLANGLEQTIYSPPNVGGWSSYRAWISTVTYPYRVAICNNLISNMDKSEFVSLGLKIDNYEDMNFFVSGMYALYLPIEPTEIRMGDMRTHLVKKLNFSATDWTNRQKDSEFFANAVKELLLYIVKLPDFQLI